MIRDRRALGVWIWALALALVSLALSPRAARADDGAPQRADEERAFVVLLPHLGPMLVVGRDAESATHAYVEGLVRRNVFPDVKPDELRAWGREVAQTAGRAPTLDALRATGRPLIGVQLNSKDDLVGSDEWKARRSLVAKAVVQSGAVPVFLPPGSTGAQIPSELARIDHLVLMGGADVSPELQPGVTPSGKFPTNLKIDRDEQEVLRQALVAGLGVHAICRGSQLVQVTFGGRLIQDIPTSGLTTLDHGSGQGPGTFTSHPIHFERDSEIGQNLGNHLSVKALHHHHQAVDPEHVAPGFRVVATAHDGIPEAIEGLDGRVIGVQVHPEAASKGSSLRRAFFDRTLMQAALERMDASGRSATPTLAARSPRALTLAIHSTVGANTERPTWSLWRAPPAASPLPRVAPPAPARLLPLAPSAPPLPMARAAAH